MSIPYLLREREKRERAKLPKVLLRERCRGRSTVTTPLRQVSKPTKETCVMGRELEKEM